MILEILLAIIPVFIMVAIGCACRGLRIVDERSEKSLMQLVLLVLYPCFILSEVPGNQSLKSFTNVGLALGCGVLLTLIGFGAAYLCGKMTGVSKGIELRTFCLATAIQNYGFIPIPLIEALFPEFRQEYLGVLFVHNLGLELVLWTLGVTVVSGKRQGALRRLINGPSVAILLGLLLNFTGWYEIISQPVSVAMHQLGACTIPISLLLVGISMAGVLMNEKWSFRWRISLAAMLTRFVVMPTLILIAAAVVASQLQFQALAVVLTIEAAMPSAIFPIVISKHFGGKPSVAVQVVVVTSVLSLLATPLLLALGLSLLETS